VFLCCFPTVYRWDVGFWEGDTCIVGADGLVICELSQHKTQVQTSRLAKYAACKNLTVNVFKCTLMVCNDKRMSVRTGQVVSFLRSPLCGAEPLDSPVRRGGGGGG
jgi:hypothetical protein